MDVLEAFAANLRRERLAKGLTQEQLASVSGVDLASVGRIERAERDPGVRTVARLAHGLDLPAHVLLAGLPDPRANAD